MDGAREIERRDDCQVVQWHVLAVALIDLERDKTGTMAISWVGHRLTRTSESAAAVLDVLTFNLPLLSGHVRSSPRYFVFCLQLPRSVGWASDSSIRSTTERINGEFEARNQTPSVGWGA